MYIYDLYDQKRWIVHKDKKPYSATGSVNLQSGNNRACKRGLDLEKRHAPCATYRDALEQVDKYSLDGVGIVLGLPTDNVRVLGIDLDNCFDDEGKLYPFAEHVVKAMGSYTECSVSGNGIHILGLTTDDHITYTRAATGEVIEKPGIKLKIPNGNGGLIGLEIYAEYHYFVFTEKGNVDVPLADLTDKANALLTVINKGSFQKRTEKRAEEPAKSKEHKDVPATSGKKICRSLEQIMSVLRSYRNKKLNSILDSPLVVPADCEYPSGSEVDAYLLYKISRLTNDPKQIREIMFLLPRAVARRDRWESGSYDGLDWLDNEIQKAVSQIEPIKPKKKKPAGAKEVQYRKTLQKVSHKAIEARIKGQDGAATDEECRIYAETVKRSICRLTVWKREKLVDALERYNLTESELEEMNKLPKLQAAIEAVKDDETAYTRACHRYTVAEKYVRFRDDEEPLNILIDNNLGPEINNIRRLGTVTVKDKDGKDTSVNLYQDIVLPEMERCIPNRMGVTADGISQQNSYPDERQYLTVSPPVNALYNPKNEKHAALVRGEPVTFDVVGYPDISVWVQIPEKIQSDISSFDRNVLDALFSVAEWNKSNYLPLNLVCQVVRGKRDFQPTEKDRQAVRDAVWRLNNILMHYQKGNRWIEGGLINTLIFGETINNQDDVVTIFLNGIQLIWQYSKEDLNFVERYPSKYREIPGLRYTEANSVLVQYLLQYILIRRRMIRQAEQGALMSEAYKAEKTFGDKLQYKTIWEQTGIGQDDTNATRRRKRQNDIINKTLPTVFNYWVEVGLIHQYSIDDGCVNFDVLTYAR